MKFRRVVLAAIFVSLPLAAAAQSEGADQTGLLLELNTLQDVEGACRLTFLIDNKTGSEIDAASFETVIFDASGSVVSLSLFNFRDLPAGRPRVRQFDLPGMTCAGVGRALINGANTCVVAGADSQLCDDTLKLNSRTEVELLG
ncbi:hypothetical protein [Ruegeria sp. HKCCA5491]|uniref:hypothetical protein n=1 Tax=Ruegeria sp. HKCCA5491 TaxID=2682986 RepID=UPI0014898203|nr:hypothetical protein [Ruegeria sp. HKCCA5491]